MLTIGIDIGTTTISAAVVDSDTRTTVETRTIQNGCFMRSAHAWESIQDPEKIVKKAQDLLDQLLGQYPGCSAIGLTGQMHGIAYVDDKGHTVSPLYTWQDQRGNELEADGKCLIDRITERFPVHAATGYGLVTHMYQCMHQQVPERAVTFCTIMDYLGMRLTGRGEPLIHVSNAASFGLFDSRHYRFATEVLDAFEVGLDQLPAVTKDLEVLGSYHGIPVVTAVGDNQASFLGSVGLQDQTLLINMGTGGQISVLSDTFFETEDIEARPFLEGKYLLVGSALCSGRAYALLEQFFRSYLQAAAGVSVSQYTVMAALAQKGAMQKADRMKVCTQFSGKRSDTSLRGAVSNLSEHNFTPQGLTYGVLEGMSRELYELYVQIREQTGLQAHSLIGSGNAIRQNPVLQEIISQMFGVKLQLCSRQEEAACGAAFTAALCL